MLRQIVGISVTTASMVNKFQNTQTTAQIEFLPGKDWLTLNITSGTAELSEKSKVTDAGIMYEQKLKTEIPADRMTKETVVCLVQFHLFIRIIYNNGDLEIIGCPDLPARLITDLNVKQSSYYKLEFTCNTIYKAFRLIS